MLGASSPSVRINLSLPSRKSAKPYTAAGWPQCGPLVGGSRGLGAWWTPAGGQEPARSGALRAHSCMCTPTVAVEVRGRVCHALPCPLPLLHTCTRLCYVGCPCRFYLLHFALNLEIPGVASAPGFGWEVCRPRLPGLKGVPAEIIGSVFPEPCLGQVSCRGSRSSGCWLVAGSCGGPCFAGG